MYYVGKYEELRREGKGCKDERDAIHRWMMASRCCAGRVGMLVLMLVVLQFKQNKDRWNIPMTRPAAAKKREISASKGEKQEDSLGG